MNRYRGLAWPMYLVATMLVIVPFFDATMSVWPLNPGSGQWRFGAIGLFSNAFMIPATGVLVAYASAITLGHGKVLRGLGWLCGAGAVIVAGMLLAFAMDAFETRLNIQETARLDFAVASFTAAGKLLFAIATLIAFSIASRRTRRDVSAAAAAKVRA